jgi:hypothetical protein
MALTTKTLSPADSTAKAVRLFCGDQAAILIEGTTMRWRAQSDTVNEWDRAIPLPPGITAALIADAHTSRAGATILTMTGALWFWSSRVIGQDSEQQATWEARGAFAKGGA